MKIAPGRFPADEFVPISVSFGENGGTARSIGSSIRFGPWAVGADWNVSAP
jgi:hypothetical protein